MLQHHLRNQAVVTTPPPLKFHPAYSQMDVFIDCEGDRYSAPLQLLNPTGWQQRAAEIGKRYGEKWLRIKAETDHPNNGIVQWWNEAYLNWAERSAGHPFDGGSIIKPKWYDLERAVDGGPVHLPGVEEPLKTHDLARALANPYRDGLQPQRTKSMEYDEIGWSIPIPDGLDYGDTFRSSRNALLAATRSDEDLDRHPHHAAMGIQPCAFSGLASKPMNFMPVCSIIGREPYATLILT